MLGLFVGRLLPVEAYLGITLSVSDSCHCKIHTDLAALAREVVSETLKDLGIDVLCNADNVLGGPGHAFVLLDKLGAVSSAEGALEALRNRIAFINITANGTYEFHSNFSFSFLRFLFCFIVKLRRRRARPCFADSRDRVRNR